MHANHESFDLRHVAPNLLRDPPTNPNRMPAGTYALLVEAIRAVGFLQPVLAVDAGEDGLVLVDGAHRVRAARELGLATIPVVVGDFRGSDEAARVVQIGMNRMRGELDLAAVAQSVAALAGAGWTLPELELTGFSRSELDDLLATTRHQDDAVLEGGLGPAPDDGDDGASLKPYVLELTFARREELAKAKRGLRKAAGKGRELAEGLLRLLDGT